MGCHVYIFSSLCRSRVLQSALATYPVSVPTCVNNHSRWSKWPAPAYALPPCCSMADARFPTVAQRFSVYASLHLSFKVLHLYLSSRLGHRLLRFSWSLARSLSNAPDYASTLSLHGLLNPFLYMSFLPSPYSLSPIHVGLNYFLSISLLFLFILTFPCVFPAGFSSATLLALVYEQICRFWPSTSLNIGGLIL